MKLRSSPLSPFASRVRMAIHAGSLPVEVVPAGMWTDSGQKSPDYLALNPIGRVPTLIFDDGTALPESDTIVEFLADTFPRANLRPATPARLARARLLPRIFEQYVLTAGWGTLFGQLFRPTRDQPALDGALARMDEGLRSLDHFMPGDAYAVGDHLTTADCALVPFLEYQVSLCRALGQSDPLTAHRKVADYWGRIQEDTVARRVLAEMREGLVGSRLAMLVAAS